MSDLVSKNSKQVLEVLREITSRVLEFSKVAKNAGWYCHPSLLFLIQRDCKEDDDMNEFISKVIESEWDSNWITLLSFSEKRKLILLEGKKCFEVGLYGAAIHIFLSQADGIFFDKTGENLYDRGGVKAAKKFMSELPSSVKFESEEQLIGHLKNGKFIEEFTENFLRELVDIQSMEITLKTRNITDEKELLIPNRHGVLHGVHFEYGNKLNALKTFTFLMSIAGALGADGVA